MNRMSPGRQPSPPSTKPRRPTTQLSRANTRPTSLCTTRSREMTGSPGPCGQHPRSGHPSGVRPAGRALQPETARRCTPRRPSACKPWSTGLRYGSRCWQTSWGSISPGPEELSVQAPWVPPRPHPTSPSWFTHITGGESEILKTAGHQQKCRRGL